MDNLIKKSNYRYFLFIILISISEYNINAQNIISDGKGTSSISLNPGFKETSKESSVNSPKVDTVSFNLGLIRFTTTDKKIELNHFSYFQSEKFTDIFFGVSATGEIKNSVANLFSSGNIVPGGEANLKFGIRLFRNKTNWPELLAGKTKPEEIQNILENNTKPASDLWLIASGGFTGTSFKLFQPDSVFSKQIEKTDFTGIEINVGFNYWNARILNNTILAGATIGYKKTNNFDDLNESTQEDTKVVTDVITSTSRKIVTKQTVYTGAYKEKIVYPLKFDLYYVPHKLENISFLGYCRIDISKTVAPITKLGLGVFFLRKQNAFNPIAGITFDYADAFNTDKSDDAKGALSKFRIGITTRINIVNDQMRK